MDGKKVPNARINDPSTWSPFDKVKDQPTTKQGGIGWVFTEGNDIGGIDLDACRNIETGELTKWALAIVKTFKSYTEISPSGTGVKIWASGCPPKISPNVVLMTGPDMNGKKPAIEAYTVNRYFAVTGNLFPDSPMEVRNAPEAWLKLVQFIRDNSAPGSGQPSQGAAPIGPTQGAGRNSTLTSLAGTMRKRGMDYDTILIALRSENDKRFTPPLPEAELIAIAKSVCRYSPQTDGFIRSGKGDILKDSQENLQTAFKKMELGLSYNIFADKLIITEKDKAPQILNDPFINRLWLEIDAVFHFRPTIDFFVRTLTNECHRNPFHPVRQYLDALKWDGTPRIHNWLTTYAKAADNDYTKAVGKIVLVAAVRRIRKPGCKFDEMLILESPQGLNKSSFLNTLAVEDDWFTDDLPLTSESKEVIEKTAGKWIIEAAELSGMKKGDVETLKSFLSRKTETARLSYERVTTERARHFIVVGTTNAQYYLKDTTGNRRFWPVRVEGFDMDQLEKDRDQLWAEASQREKDGESIRLDPSLYGMAGIAQGKRQVDDPWEHVIEDVVGEMNGKLSTEDIWQLLKVDVNRRTQNENGRLGEVMRTLGFERKKARINGKIQWTYQRGSDQERQHNQIHISFDMESGSTTATIKENKNPSPHPED